MSKVACTLIAALVAPISLTAQVGHDPAHSPYRPIAARTSLNLVGGYLGGSGGTLGIGPSGGYLAGLRYEMRLTGPTDAALTLSRGQFDRLIRHPNAPADSQPASQPVFLVDGGLQILLTGDKTWNRLAPYVGGSLGLAFGSGLAADSSGYRFGTKFITGPHAGIRLYPAGGVMLRVEGRLTFWRLRYPIGFFNAPVGAPGDPPLLNPAVQSDTEWTAHPTVIIALGWAFRL
jgi:hypothetical protein